ncbi:MAG: hypothetical protein WCI91_02200 [Candidatus Nomurabacteria bacterium]
MENIENFLKKIDSGEGNLYLCGLVAIALISWLVFIIFKEIKSKKA